PAPAGPTPHRRRRRPGRRKAPRAWARRSALAQTMAVLGREVEAVNAAQVRDPVQGCGLERRLVLQGMQGDALEQVAEREVEIFGQALQHLEQALLQPHAGLDALDLVA